MLTRLRLAFLGLTLILALTVYPTPLLPDEAAAAEAQEPDVPQISNLVGKIVFFSSRDYGSSATGWPKGWDLYAINPDGTGLLRLTNGSGIGYLSAPAVSPDGTQIIVGYGKGVKLFGADGSPGAYVAVPGTQAWVNDWSVTGHVLLTVFGSRTDIMFDEELYSLDMATKQFRRLTNDAARNLFAAWSPDGSQIAYMSDYTLWIMNADGSNKRQIFAGEARDLDWSPDGKQIVFESLEVPQSSSDYEFWVINVDGTGRRRITNTPDRHINEPVWSPDGHSVAFSYWTSNYRSTGLGVLDLATGTMRNLTAPAGDEAPFWTAPAPRYAISGRILDQRNVGIPGVSVSYGAGRSVVTNASGEYVLEGLSSGTYTLTPSKSGYTFTPASRPVTVPPSKLDINFVGTINTSVVTGSVEDAAGIGISGVTISDGAGHNATTDVTGSYTLVGLSAGSYVIRPSTSGLAFCPRSRSIAVPPDQSSQNFSGSPSGADLGFCPEPDGFRFANKQLWRTWPMFEQFYGPDQVRQADGSICGTAQGYYNQTYRGVANGWSCFGFTLGSLHSYQNRSQLNAGTFAIAHYDRLYAQAESSQLTDPITYYSGAQLSQQFADEYGAWLTACDQDPNQIVERVRQALQSGNPLLLGLNAGKVYHAIAPYRLVTASADETHLYVYDSEAPGQQRIVRLLRSGSAWQWRYTFTGSLANAGTRTGGCRDMYYYQAAASVERGKPLVNLCEATNLAVSGDASGVTSTNRLLGVLPVVGDWIIQDSLGRRLGWTGGQWLAEIPDAYELPQTFGEATPPYRALYLPSGSYTIQASATSNRQIAYSLFADGKVLVVSGQTSSSDGTSQISVTPAFDAITVTHPADLTSLAIDVTRELPAASRVAGLRSNAMSGTDDLQVRYDGEKMQVARTNSELQYTVSFHEVGGTGGYFVSEPVTLQANEAHALHPSNWDGLTASTVVLDIDQGQDGTVDETRVLTNQVKRVFLPVILTK